jgi:hypothetical protein
MGAYHFGGRLKRCSNLDQWSRSDTRAGAGGPLPVADSDDEFGPQWKQPALGGLGRVDRAAAGQKKRALPAARLAESEQMSCPIDKTPLEPGRREAEVRGGAEQVILRQINVARLVATAGASGLTGKTKHTRHAQAGPLSKA